MKRARSDQRFARKCLIELFSGSDGGESEVSRAIGAEWLAELGNIARAYMTQKNSG